MNLVIDIGNTQYKVSVFNKHEMEFHRFYTQLTTDAISRLIDEYQVKKAIFSDTRGVKSEEFKKLFPKNIVVTELSYTTKLPISLNYHTPETLGKDRIAGAVGGHDQFSNYPVLIIDIGTAITIDFVTAQGIFEGGIISPGPEMRFKALKDYTGKLPLVEPGNSTNLYGKTTETAIRNGVQNGILFEINEYILRYTKQYSNIKVILTGGFSYLFDKKINYPIFAEPFLIPKGLNRIQLYNE